MRTYRCMIVDDEDLILERLQHFFAKHADEFVLVGKAYTGAEGVELAATVKPDIVVTDIVMPEMDGIAMIEQLQQHRPSLKCIILSAYSEFNYAQQAMRLNVWDYIVKVPLNENDLLHALRKAAQGLHEQETYSAEMARINQTNRKNMHRVRKQVFAELLRGDLPAASIDSWKREMMLDLNMDSYIACIVRIEQYRQFQRTFSLADQRILRYGLLNVAEESLQAYGQGFMFEQSDAVLAGFVSWPYMHSHSEQIRRSHALGSEIVQHARHYLKLHVSVAFSGVFQGQAGLLSAYKHASEVADLLYYKEKGSGIQLPHQQQLLPSPPEAEAEIRKQLTTLQARVKAGAAQPELDSDLSRLPVKIREAWIKPYRVAALLREAAEELSAWSAISATHLQRPEWQSEVFALFRLEEQLQLFGELVKDILLHRESSGRQEVLRAKSYIHEHLTERLTLQQVAEYVGLSPNYFSALFKKEENIGLVDYINHKKIELAQSLLLEANYSNFDLSEKVGIGNERYFCTLFRHYTGSSPQKFRKKLKT